MAIVALVFGNVSGYGQAGRFSQGTKPGKMIQVKLGLSDAVFNSMTAAEKDMRSRTDSLNGSKALTIEDRRKVLKEIVQQYHAQIQGILTAGQWQQFRQLEEETRDRFLRRMKDGKTPVKELD